LKQTLTEEIFPGIEIFEDYVHPSLIYSGTGYPMQLDVYIPSLSLAFEYQGIQHYKDVFRFGSTPLMYQIRDKQKREACAAAKITLIEIPYWWNKHKESLLATIHQARPDMVAKPTNAQPIPMTPPNVTRSRRPRT
jgi:hypothetical protein